MKLASFNALMYNNINNNNNTIMDHLEERPNSSNSCDDDSLSTTNFTSISSPKRSRRAIPKKVVMIPIKDLESSKFKSDYTPPSDSWAWRKYGQKPIKGSPYPRGYYRCSSSKGCPARKQVERSRSDPTMLVVTYSHEHNHPWPTSRHHHHRVTTTIASTTPPKINNINNPKLTRNIQFQKTNNNNNIQHIQLFLNNRNNNSNNNNNNDNNIDNNNNSNNNNMDHLEQPLNVPMDELTWLSTDHEILQNDFIFSNNNNFNDLDMSKLFPMREEDESFFGDLGELPEYPVFRKPTVIAGNELQYHQQQQQQQYNSTPTPWCGSTG